MTVPTITLNNGVGMPAIGYGVFQTPPGQTRIAVTTALETGYRHIDTAAAYGNEREVGEAIAASGLARDEVFVETKVWITDFGYDQTLHAFDKSAGKLGLDTLDLFLSAYGAFAGDMAMVAMARGGVYLAGGIAAKLLPVLRQSGFLAAFKAKAEHAAIAARMPIHVATDPLLGLRGALRLARNNS